MTGQQPTTPAEAATDAERILLQYIRDYVAFVDAQHRTQPGHLYATPSHLLLAQGRLCNPGPLPKGIGKLPDTFCFENAARVARRHDLLYAEGLAAFNTASGVVLCLPHAWCVTPAGTVVDPTWDSSVGQAYLGIVITDPALWPTDNRGLLNDFALSTALLSGEINLSTLAQLGRPLPPPMEQPVSVDPSN